MQRLAKGKVSVSEGYEIIRHAAEVRQGLDAYRFEIDKVVDGITVYFIDENHRKFMIVSLDEMLEMIPDGISQKRYRNIVDNAQWLILDGIHEFRGMARDEIAAFLRLKEEVLDDMVASLV